MLLALVLGVATGALAPARGALRQGSAPPLAGGPAYATGIAPVSTGQVQRRTLRADPRQEYFLYVPKDVGRGAPLFVTVHGISRNALEHATLFSSLAAVYGVVLVAPLFAEPDFRDYQRLGRAGHGARADLALDAILAEVADLTGASAAKFHLFGFSGGAQFAHRYAMAHPQRVARAVIASAGWFTLPDSTIAYPYGIAPSQDLPNLRFDPQEFLQVPIAVFVGDRDSTSKSLRHNEQVDLQQGVTRFARARNWVTAMRAAALARHLEPLVTYEQVEDIHHSFKQFMQQGHLGDRTFAALFGSVPSKKRMSGDDAGPNEKRSGLLQPMRIASWVGGDATGVALLSDRR